MKIVWSGKHGGEAIVSWDELRDALREHATPQPSGDGGVKVIEGINVLSFDDDNLLTFITPRDGASYTVHPAD